MQKSKLLKSILIPTLGISAIGSFAAISEGTATITVSSFDNPNAKDTCEVNVKDPASRYVVLTANEDSTLALINEGENHPNLWYSTDGTNWYPYVTSININQGQSLYLKGYNPWGWSHDHFITHSTLSITGDVSIFGNVMGLLDDGAKSGEEGDITSIPCAYCFYRLFQNSTGITSVSDSFLPATTLTNGCYACMFQGCTSLTTAPALPTTTLATGCYGFMFNGCSSLTTAPALPATTLAKCCYYDMFQGCTSLTTAPELPATTLAYGCYWAMFAFCSSLSTAPALPATTLADYCYSDMFSDCTSLNSIKIAYTGNYDSTYFSDWVSGVASFGTFYYNGSQTAQDFQLPSGWRKPLDEFINILANEDSTLALINEGENHPILWYSTDGTNWYPYVTSININQGQSLYLKGDNSWGWSHDPFITYSTLSITGDVSIFGNVMGLLDDGAKPGEQGDITSIPCAYCFYRLFQNSTGITSVGEDFLPATTLADDCYEHMFQGCTSLTTAPDLPAKTLANDCYRAMFWNCSSLTTAPDLPATTLAYDCYSHMFYKCTSLSIAPTLPATTLVNNCYYSMFAHCTSLTTAPELPATTLANDCYREMFYNCTSLNSVKIGYTGNYNSDFMYWVYAVASFGTFYYNGSQTPQDFQFPSGWTKSPF